jgi:hypothetical protein
VSLDDDLPRLMLGHTQEGRILIRVLDRLAALEAAHAKAVKRAELAYDAIAEFGPVVKEVYGRIERMERTAVDLGDALIDLINQVAPNPARLAGPWEERLDAIRQDLAEIDRQRQPQPKE